MNKIKGILRYLIVFSLIFTPLLASISEININESNIALEDNLIDLKTSDIAGTDLYAEQISVQVAGSKSLITQSLFTNDTNILSRFDTNDPAFYKCNIHISASNGINPEIYPNIITSNPLSSQFDPTFNSFSGFLFYDSDLTDSEVRSKSSRALEIIRRKFEMDLIMVNSSNSRFFPFVGYYPEWGHFFEELTSNFPNDGYWKALDTDRLTSSSYYENQHLSASFMVINSLEILELMINLPTDQVDYNLGALDLSFAEGLDLGDLGSLFNTTDVSIGLSENAHYTTLSIQYEGVDEGIETIGSNQYLFDLWKAMNYTGNPLRPSEKIFISLLGIFMSTITINIICTEVVDSTPRYFEFDAYTLQRLETLLSLASIDFDLQALEDTSWELLWVNEYGTFSNYIRPVYLDAAFNPMSVLINSGFQGIPSIFSGLLEEISQFKITYNISDSEPNMKITREIIGGNASFGMDQELVFNITAENVGNTTAWGVPYANLFAPDLNTIIIGATGGNIFLYNQLDTLVRNEYGQSLENFLNFDDEVRVFEIDSFGTGTVDYYYPFNPALATFANQVPYSPLLAEEMANSTDPTFSVAQQNLFKNVDSIRNPDNWNLDPGERITYNISSDVSASDSYTTFHLNNFTLNQTTPEILNGTEILNTNSTMALHTDNLSWIIASDNWNYTDVNFYFQNKTAMDLENYSLDRILITFNFTINISVNDGLETYIFNYSLGSFQNVTTSILRLNRTWMFSFVNYNNSLNSLFNPAIPNNYSIMVKLNGTSSAPFNISIDDFDIEYQMRDVNSVTRQAARIIFAPSSRISQINRRSGTSVLSTDNMTSIEATASLSSYNSSIGEINTYSLHLKNVGSKNAENISLAFIIPGIIHDANYFTIGNNTLSYSLRYLNVSEEKSINFTFYTPNSGVISGIQIIYFNPEIIQNTNSSLLITSPNQVYLSAPVNYENKLPFVRVIKIYYNTSSSAPEINEVFNLTVTIENISPYNVTIPDLSLKLNDRYDGLVRIDKISNFNFSNIAHTDIISFNITLNKTRWDGYYYPAINFVQSSEGRTLQISSSSHIVLGNISFSITKVLTKYQVEKGESFGVTITVKNTGTICVKNVNINDVTSYSGREFSLTSGKLVNEISCLEPGETIVFGYTLKAKVQKTIVLKEASIDYYFLSKTSVESNQISIKINTPHLTQLLYILIPCIIALGAILIYLWQSNKYKVKKHEMKRHEMSVYKYGAKDSILKIEHTLRERLNVLSRENVIVKRKETDSIASIAANIVEKKSIKKKSKKKSEIKEENKEK